MTICKPTALLEALGPGQCLLGLDVGTKTVGIAVSDRARIIASPLTVIRRTKFTKDAEALFTLIDDNDVGALVVGLPVEMDGNEGRQAQYVRTFVDNLLNLRDLTVAFWDERLSTVAVERMMVEKADLSRKKRGKVVDRAAAAYILQGVIDLLRKN
ncbi:MAG: Holliday junction resolvase RuvX [Alphaproteobacteria bacterium]|nr:Holliday junction resolvase RuvX [Alphaproteobacteria bacterium]